MQEIVFTPGIPHQRFGVTLGRTPMVIEARWNERAPTYDRDNPSAVGAWYMDLYDADDLTNPVAVGVKIVLGTFLARNASHPTLTTGAILVQDRSRKDREPTLDDLGTRVRVWYFEDSHLVLIRDAQLPEDFEFTEGANP